ncbi:MAG: hypothetical protein IK141_04260 [Clostridia bacterium]|nr:hypothetical protein [Clostridia bacterium]
MKKTRLQHPYLTIRQPDGRLAYGGDQSVAQDKVMRRCGCGVVGGICTAGTPIAALRRFPAPTAR